MRYCLYILVLVSISSFGQLQQPLTLWRSIGGFYNPSFTLDDRTNTDFFVKNSWMSSSAQSFTYIANVSKGIERKHISLGVGLFHSNLTSQLESGFRLYGNYRLNTSNGQLRFGLSLGMFHMKSNFTNGVVKNLDDPYLLSSGINRPDIMAGLTYQSDETVIAVGVNHLNQPGNSLFETESKLSRAFNLLAVHTIQTNGRWAYSPMVNGRYKNRVLADLTLYCTYEELFWVGPLLRTNGSIGCVSGLKLSNVMNLAYDVKIGMSYDYPVLNQSFGTSAGGIEFVVNVKPLSLPKPEEIRQHKRVVSPIFL